MDDLIDGVQPDGFDHSSDDDYADSDASSDSDLEADVRASSEESQAAKTTRSQSARRADRKRKRQPSSDGEHLKEDEEIQNDAQEYHIGELQDLLSVLDCAKSVYKNEVSSIKRECQQEVEEAVEQQRKSELQVLRLKDEIEKCKAIQLDLEEQYSEAQKASATEIHRFKQNEEKHLRKIVEQEMTIGDLRKGNVKAADGEANNYLREELEKAKDSIKALQAGRENDQSKIKDLEAKVQGCKKVMSGMQAFMDKP